MQIMIRSATLEFEKKKKRLFDPVFQTEDGAEDIYLCWIKSECQLKCRTKFTVLKVVI